MLMLGKQADSEVSGHIYELIYELNQVAPSILLAVIPQLEFKLKVCQVFKPALRCSKFLILEIC